MSGTQHPVGGRGRAGAVLSGLAVAVGCLLFLGGFAWGAVVYRPYTVPSDSMVPTLRPGDRILAQRIDGAEVRRGDVVVFRDTLWGDTPMVKRVVGVGGDKISCCGTGGRLTVNGTPVPEPYLSSPGQASPTNFSATVPDGHLFLLGDQRWVSLDSRIHLKDQEQGSVPRSAVTARVDAVAWPFTGLDTVERPDGFAALPGGVSRPGPVRIVAGAVATGAVLVLLGAAYGPVAGALARRRTRAGALAERTAGV
ncbi:signal peptidase I [Streptomyces sp. LP05-1]|uniref:Signal peptidase I n=1 Tax=Streptomyces pyxinae TaxID=2970734 RepID=A0ABT2CIN5_9ACTN|nr:signal peptidase I [Streptomyces sp. LP05-1]MCS0636571.1 signal peptidase I [Streptomyces sp. LP05-1]